jgi:predicted MFS family arabinose efflux permease
VGRSRRYEMAVVATLCFAWGVASFEALGINYLIPFIAPNLALSNVEIGILASVFWVPFGLSSYLAGEVTDQLGKRRALLLLTMALLSTCSVLSGIATSFSGLLTARLLMGLLEGPILPIAQSIIALEFPLERRALNMGIVQTLGSGLTAGLIAPLFLVWIAVHHGWRAGFFVTLLPGLSCTALIALLVREPLSNTAVRAHSPATTANRTMGFGHVLQSRNIWLCSLLALLFVAQSLIGLSYLPLFFVKVRQFVPAQMSLLMSALGIAAMVMGIAVPALSDQIGRKPTVILASLLGMSCPLAALYYSGPLPFLSLLMFLGWAPNTTVL